MSTCGLVWCGCCLSSAAELIMYIIMYIKIFRFLIIIIDIIISRNNGAYFFGTHFHPRRPRSILNKGLVLKLV